VVAPPDAAQSRLTATIDGGRMREGRGGAILVAGALLAALVAPLPGGCRAPSSRAGEVVVYTSVDQVYAEPVLLRFEEATGVRVRAVYDAEAAKTTGLVNRLIAEKSRPRADVWWSGEIVQTLKLAEGGVLAPYVSSGARTIPTNLKDPGGLWTGFGGRVRVLLLAPAFKGTVPTSIRDLATPPDTAYAKPRIAMANPVFGTAATQAPATTDATAPAGVAGEITMPNGLKYVDLVVGGGAEAKSGSDVKVHYTGTFPDGREFDSSRNGGQPYPFRLGASQVIRGWDQGIPGMRVGGKRRLTIPPDLGYGARGYPPVIPPHSTLVFEVELLGLQ